MNVSNRLVDLSTKSPSRAQRVIAKLKIKAAQVGNNLGVNIWQQLRGETQYTQSPKAIFSNTLYMHEVPTDGHPTFLTNYNVF